MLTDENVKQDFRTGICSFVLVPGGLVWSKGHIVGSGWGIGNWVSTVRDYNKGRVEERYKESRGRH